jgi:predicted nucleotidyltransferase
MIPESIKLLANDIKPYLNKIINKYSNIETIWLYGKRANGDHNQESDWDLFVFANGRVLDLLKADIELKNESEKNNIDLLVVFDGENFKAPWKRPGEENKRYKESCLTGVGGFGWSKLSEVEAEYTEVKGVEGQMHQNTQLRKAWRIWP